MFRNEVVIGSVRAQVDHLKDILSQMETDGCWEDHGSYYAREIHDIEKKLRNIRKADFDPADGCN